MILELAPMEGLTTYVYRNAFARHFGSIDRYYTPFLSLHKEKEFNHKERQEILPENNRGLCVIPQVLTNSSEDFLKAAGKLQDLGYQEVNINFGCPSGTVTTKAKGAGMLAYPERLDRFLAEIFEHTTLRISIKTRLGMEQPEEWERLLEIYNQYPICQMIIHARVRADFYANTPNWDAFGKAVTQSVSPVCYNGDIFTVADYERLKTTFPDVESVMLGRGLLAHPGLAEHIRQLSAAGNNGHVTEAMRESVHLARNGAELERLQAFHDEVYAGYHGIQFGYRNVLFKMKELWHYMVHSFPNAEKHEKKLRKVNSCAEYESYVKNIFALASNEEWV